MHAHHHNLLCLMMRSMREILSPKESAQLQSVLEELIPPLPGEQRKKEKKKKEEINSSLIKTSQHNSFVYAFFLKCKSNLIELVTDQTDSIRGRNCPILPLFGQYDFTSQPCVSIQLRIPLWYVKLTYLRKTSCL